MVPRWNNVPEQGARPMEGRLLTRQALWHFSHSRCIQRVMQHGGVGMSIAVPGVIGHLGLGEGTHEE